MSMLEPTKPTSTRAAKQSMAAESDVNVIVAKSRRLGVIPSAHTRPPMYLDLTGIGTAHAALTHIARAQQTFEALPAKVREKCGNNIKGYLELLTDKKRRDLAIELGLIKPESSSPKGEKKDEPKTTPDEKGGK